MNNKNKKIEEAIYGFAKAFPEYNIDDVVVQQLISWMKYFQGIDLRKIIASGKIPACDHKHFLGIVIMLARTIKKMKKKEIKRNIKNVAKIMESLFIDRLIIFLKELGVDLMKYILNFPETQKVKKLILDIVS